MIRPLLPGVVESIIEAVPLQVPAYARPIEGRFGRGLRSGVATALERFLELPGTRKAALSPESRKLVEGLGIGECRQGRSMDALLGAYRTGARVTFREMSKVATEHHLGMEAVVTLGECILAYIDELSAVSAEAYAFEQSLHAGQQGRRRTELLELLLHGRADEVSAFRAAAVADWQLPTTLRAVFLPLARASGVGHRLGPGALLVERDSDAVALVPARGSARAHAELSKALRGRGACIGTAVPWQQAADSLRLAMLAATAIKPAEGTDGPPIWAEEHLTDLLLASEPTVVSALATQSIRELEDLRPGQRKRLTLTLASWLRHWGQRAPMAQELGVHVQTVGYRIAQLREVFGEALDDPQRRLDMQLALRAPAR
ncbi:helix-turn-helix domain-containing protein [Paeniglutamicibacter cryotolerans]|uniref:PucR family transcriptional regulator n=1 Tax=Paeniglutamicibacter cryotolerans TaxID=670079 RepID=A0A839QCR3_9MICC|nr:PucR family transcriptional regulator [Paeniglutamicibacter cryotolerans]MBB2993918.1 hypothetical protein [Paeniglutamicibacter cryotolerans]